jgi:hypothetical protein
MRIKVMADYGCHALWWDDDPSCRVGNLDPATLGLSPALVAALAAWAGAFDATLDEADPAASAFSTAEAAAAFEAEGEGLARRVAAELGPAAQVRFWRPDEAAPD